MLSFELLPIKSEVAMPQLLTIAERLNKVKPTFFSIASEISGAPASATVATVEFLQQKIATPLMPHITCSNKTRNDVRELLEQYLKLGVKQLLVLRGNAPPTGDFRYASELVKFITDYTDQFELTVAVYPEGDNYLPEKIAAGATRAITQFFYDIDAYERLVEKYQNFNIPIIPGILPISDVDKTIRLAKQCGVTLPKEFSIETVTELCEKLLAQGAPRLHFFTLNQPVPTLQIVNRLLFEQLPK